MWNSPLDQGGTVLGDEVTIEINREVIRQDEEPEGQCPVRFIGAARARSAASGAAGPVPSVC